MTTVKFHWAVPKLIKEAKSGNTNRFLDMCSLHILYKIEDSKVVCGDALKAVALQNE